MWVGVGGRASRKRGVMMVACVCAGREGAVGLYHGFCEDRRAAAPHAALYEIALDLHNAPKSAVVCDSAYGEGFTPSWTMSRSICSRFSRRTKPTIVNATCGCGEAGP